MAESNGPRVSGDLMAALISQQAAAESQIQEQVQWSRETHARMPLAQGMVLGAALGVIQLGILLVGLGIWQAIEGRALWLLPIVPVSIMLVVPGIIVAYRTWSDLRKPFGRRSPYEDRAMSMMERWLGTGEKEPPRERVFGLRSRQKQAVTQERQQEIDNSLFAEFVMRLPHKGTSLRAWEGELGRSQYRHFRDELIAGEYADWRVYNEKGNPVLEQGWDLLEGVTPRQIIEELS